jgi:hypothetical protein
VPIQLQGNGGTVAEVDGTVFRALRTTPRPVDVGALGAYRLAMVTGTMAAGLAAGSEIFQFRYAGANTCVVHKVMCDGFGSIAAFAAGVVSLRAIVARAYTASGSGGTAATLTGNNGKQRTSHATTGLGDFRIASTAALTTGTRTLDAQALGQVVGSVPATAGATIPEAAFLDAYGGAEHPLVLANNEGFVIQATVPGTGTWTAGITLAWSEVATY